MVLEIASRSLRAQNGEPRHATDCIVTEVNIAC